MADDDVKTSTDKPLASLADAEARIEPKADPKPEPMPEMEPEPEIPAVERLRAFEDEHFGEDVVRINGRIERGYGSKFKDASDEIRRQHAALEHLIETEQKLADAHAALIAADDAHQAALAAAEPKKPDAAAHE